jgi:hypothetical protein
MAPSMIERSNVFCLGGFVATESPGVYYAGRRLFGYRPATAAIPLTAARNPVCRRLSPVALF